ncbi:hypothetical protein [Salibacterium sp. K-3]
MQLQIKLESLRNHLLFLSLYKAARETPAKTITPPPIDRQRLDMDYLRDDLSRNKDRLCYTSIRRFTTQ